MPSRRGRSARARTRVALITSSFAPHVGGVEEHVAQVAAGLRRDGLQVEVWAVDRGVRPERPSSTPVRYLPTPLPARSPAALFRFAVRAPGAALRWMRAYRAFRPDLLHVHCFAPNGLYALGLHAVTRRPLVVTSHGETLADDDGVFARSALLRAGLRRALRRAAAVTAPSQFVLDDLRADYGLVGGRVVPNGVDLSVVPVRQDPPAPYVFAVGRLGRMKGFDLLLDAFAAASVDPAVRLVIGGDGPERAALAALADRLGLADRVEFRGWMGTQQIADAMAGALAVAVPSRAEAFGIVALEAWRSGAALLMTRRGGAAEFVTDGEDGMLVDPADTASFAAAIERVCADTALREALSAAGRSRVAEFSWDAVCELYRGLYDGVLGGAALRGRG